MNFTENVHKVSGAYMHSTRQINKQKLISEFGIHTIY